MITPPWILELLENNSLPASRVRSVEARQQLEILTNLGLVKTELYGRSKKRIVVIQPAEYKLWVNAEYNSIADSEVETLPRRAKNIAERGGSKSGKSSHEVQPLIFRWFAADDQTLLAQLTAQFGVIGVTSDRVDKLNLPEQWRLLTVENWESFYILEYHNPQPPILAVYLGGNVSEVVLEALAAIAPQPAKVLHFGDYDWAGLNIFGRLCRHLPHARWYLPDNLASLFKQHRDLALVQNQADYAQIRHEHPDIAMVIDLISRTNAGLEQEIVSPPAEKDW